MLRLLLVPAVWRRLLLLLLLLIPRIAAVVLLLRRWTGIAWRHGRIHIFALRIAMRCLMKTLCAGLFFGLHLGSKTCVIVDLMR